MYAMKYVIRAGLACAALALIAAISSASPNLNKCHQSCDPAGAWVGFWEGPSILGGINRIEWAWTAVPLDPEGRTFAMHVQWLTLGTDFETL